MSAAATATDPLPLHESENEMPEFLAGEKYRIRRVAAHEYSPDVDGAEVGDIVTVKADNPGIDSDGDVAVVLPTPNGSFDWTFIAAENLDPVGPPPVFEPAPAPLTGLPLSRTVALGEAVRLVGKDAPAETLMEIAEYIVSGGAK